MTASGARGSLQRRARALSSRAAFVSVSSAHPVYLLTLVLRERRFLETPFRKQGFLLQNLPAFANLSALSSKPCDKFSPPESPSHSQCDGFQQPNSQRRAVYRPYSLGGVFLATFSSISVPQLRKKEGGACYFTQSSRHGSGKE